MKLYKQAHTVYKTQYHIVFPTRYRRKILTKGVAQYAETKFLEVRKHYPDWVYKEIGMDKDHVHLHMVIPPKYEVSKAVGIIKQNTSTALKRKFEFLTRDVYWDDGGIWSGGFFVSTVGIDEETIRRYVQQQGKEDAGQAKLAL